MANENDDNEPAGDLGFAPRDIPLPIAREVRQRCGFGCVICGLPLYEYDHLLGYAKVQRHVADEITLLCDRHHREVTGGLLPREAVIAANKAPFNLRTGVTKPYDLHYSGAQCEAILGSNRFTTQDQGYGTEMVPIVIDNAPIVGFILTDGHLLLNLNLFDESNNLVLQIVNNAMQLSVDAWDIDLVGQNLIVRQALRNILLDIHFEVPNRIVIRRGRLLRNGVEVLITPDYALVTNNNTFVSGCSAFNVHAGLVLGAGDPPGGAMFRIAGLNRYLGDREASRRWAEQVLRDMSPDSP